VPADLLASERRGAGGRIVLVHGFTQTGRSWRQLAEELCGTYEVVTVDAPGHGDSAAITADISEAAALLGAAGGQAIYLGYSMGGRLCLRLALERPDLVTRLILLSTTAGIADEMERANRQAADETLAAAIEQDGVDRFLQSWVAQPLFATLDEPDLDDRRRNTAAGLASSLRMAGTGAEPAVWERLGELSMPVLVIAGALDAKFVALAEQLATSIPNATLAVIPDAGHAVHLERPGDVFAAVTSWLEARDEAGG
jgi:2-succinyl-6-hydroxy-2,4-cyclohexadiene-1-carboxylate synthase